MKRHRSPFIEHAKREFQIAGWNRDRTQRKICAHVMRLLQEFSNEHHSGTTANYTLQLFNHLAHFKNISPLTTAPSEWLKVSNARRVMKHGRRLVEPAVWQSRRNSEAFSNDGGKTHYLLADRKYRRGKTVDVIKKTLTPAEVREMERARARAEALTEKKNREFRKRKALEVAPINGEALGEAIVKSIRKTLRKTLRKSRRK